ncbi:hypothetical protein [Roseateles chitinivorans]|uniref:hypothetical protein n=1 Tax=Roseateles chitinivorans TaxID=2917965 RepID=UPI003D67B9ED
MKKIVKIIPIVVIALAAGILVGWLYFSSTLFGDRSLPPSGVKPVTQASSFDRRFVATIFAPQLDDLGATVSQSYQLWLAGPDGARQLMLEADKTDGLVIVWRSPLLLEICYADAQILLFKNRFFSISRSAGLPAGETVELVLRRVVKPADCSS